MDHFRVVELLAQNAAVIREDLALLEAGTIRMTVFGADVTHDHAGRLKGNLDRLEAVLEAYGHGESHPSESRH